MVASTAMISAATMENQMPSNPHSRGKSSTAAT